MEYFKKYRIASWIHRFRYAYGIKILFRPRRPIFPKSTRGILIPCMCVCIFLIPASISRLPFHLKIFGRLNFVFTDDMHISAYSDSREIDFSSLGAARSSSQRRVKIFDLSTKDFVFTKFFSPPNFERKLRTTRAIKFYPASRGNFSIFLLGG